ncbi:MAG: AAA family ATPase [Bryobacteraceae bacterium]|nr:AAA family ATPase [Bryobacteraceae bacterium]
MICAGTFAPLAAGSNIVELCYDYFDPANAASAPPAFALHILGRDEAEQAAWFALLPTDRTRPSHWFTARWGRTGVGPQTFMPIPAQTEDDRPAVTLYGHKTSNFNWRSCQWEITSIHQPGSLDIPSLQGEDVALPVNSDSPYAWRNGVALANLDDLAEGQHDDLAIEKELEPESYLIHFGGRMWRRWTSEEAAVPLELLAFDPASPVLQSQLDEVWGDIGGQDEAKRELIRAIQWPVLYPDLFRLFKRQRSRGVLLYGPPGCGKTLLGKAVVKLLAALYHRKAEDGGFKYVKGHQLLDMYVGNSEKLVKGLFDDARRWKEQRGYPAVLFFDEADAIFKKRPSGAVDGVFTLVPALLAEMDGMDDSGAFVMLATNRPDALDEAITRPGRIDRRIRIERPDEAACRTIFRIHLDGVFLAEPLEDLCAAAAAEMFSDRYRLRDVSSGALVQNIVDRATANKMAHCIENGVRLGLDRADLAHACAEVNSEIS